MAHQDLPVPYHQQDTDYYCGAACAQMVLRSCTRHPGPNRTQSPAPLAFTERDASDLMGPRSCASHNSEFPGCHGDAAKA